MRARSALFDVYGSYLRARGGSAAIAALVRLLEPLGFEAPAIRTAVSRMVRQDWLRPVRLADGPGYALTRRAERRLDEAAHADLPHQSLHLGRSLARASCWRSCRPRSARERLDSSLRLLGYGPLGPATWVTPRPSAELAEVLRGGGSGRRGVPRRARRRRRRARRAGLGPGRARRRLRGFRDRVATQRCPQWTDRCRPRRSPRRSGCCTRGASSCSATPACRRRCCPTDWPGTEAARFFDRETARLAPAAEAFLSDCLNRGTRTRSSA